MIAIENLNFSYSKEKVIYKNLNLQQEPGNIVGLFGKNGVGKTTLLKLLCGLNKPEKGSITVNGFSPFDRVPNFLEAIYLVTDELYIPKITLTEYIKRNHIFYPNFNQDKIKNILQDFDLHLDNKLHKLSHGQQKKFIIAFALATNCKYLFFDEPTNGLDIPSKSTFRKILVKYTHEEQTIFISTHQIRDIESVLDKIIVINNQQIVFHKNIDEISETYQFQTITESELSQAIYSEKSIEGYKAILPLDTKEEETKIDLELLFNAIIKNQLN